MGRKYGAPTYENITALHGCEIKTSHLAEHKGNLPYMALMIIGAVSILKKLSI